MFAFIHEQQTPSHGISSTEIQARVCHYNKLLSFAWHTDHTDAALGGGTIDGRDAPIITVKDACDVPSCRQRGKAGSLG